MPQSDFFLPMTLVAFQAYMNFWYAQTQTRIGKGQYPMSSTTAFAQPSTQLGVKLSKLVKKARQLDCETFSDSMDVVTVKNWLKMVSDTITDMKLDDDMKLRVATRLIDKSATT